MSLGMASEASRRISIGFFEKQFCGVLYGKCEFVQTELTAFSLG